MKYAVVHGGAAHRDEILAVGLAIYADVITLSTRVIRRDPTPEELEDPKVLILDVGERHDLQRMCFDHHHLPRGTRECALSLLARHLRVKGREPMTYHELWEDRPWYRFTVGLDSLGPFAMAKELGLESLPPELNSPFEWIIIDAAENSKEFDELVKMMAFQVIGGRVEDALKLHDKLAWLKQNAEIQEVDGVKVLLVESDDVFGVNDYRASLLEDGVEVAISISHDDRGPGLCLYRFADHPRVDFSKVEGDEAVLFAHKGGFIVKTHQRNMDTARDLIRRSLI